MKKIAFFVTSLESGGIENYLIRFLEFKDSEIQPVVICKGNKFGALYNRYSKIDSIKLIKLKLSYFSVINYIKFFHYLKKNQISTVCDFTGNFAGLVLFIARIAGIKTRIAFYRGSSNHFNETTLKLWYNSLMNLLVEKFATTILSNSKAALNFFFQNKWKNNSKYKVIYNGINISNFIVNVDKQKLRDELDFPKNAFIIGHTGRFNKAKNHETLLKVANLLCKKYEDIYFVFAGKDTEKYIPPMVNTNPYLSDKIFVLGYRNDVNKILYAFDLFIFPSITEGQPNALIEAMIVGLPILASAIEPIKECVPESFWVNLIEPNDINGFLNIIANIYLGRYDKTEYILKKWGANKYNHKKLFAMFLNEL